MRSTIFLSVVGSLVFTGFTSATPLRSLIKSRAVAINGYDYAGCFMEATFGRALSSKATYNDLMTSELCATACAGYKYFGTEYGRECFCGNYLAEGSKKVAEALCSFSCPGDNSQKCGAGSHLTTYALTGTLIPEVDTPAPFKSLGCYTEATTGRALADVGFAEDSMTVAKCSAKCIGFLLFGVEYGRECYCSDALSAGSIKVFETDCSFPCSGDNGSKCGGASRLNLYTTGTEGETPAEPSSDYAHEGCYTDSVADRSLKGKLAVLDDLTIEKCSSTCFGFKFFGVEYGKECFCSNTVGTSSHIAAESDCSFPCSGDPSQKCGAGDRLNLYKFVTASQSTTSSSVFLSSTSTPTSTKTEPVTTTTTTTIEPVTTSSTTTVAPVTTTTTTSTTTEEPVITTSSTTTEEQVVTTSSTTTEEPVPTTSSTTTEEPVTTSLSSTTTVEEPSTTPTPETSITTSPTTSDQPTVTSSTTTPTQETTTIPSSTTSDEPITTSSSTTTTTPEPTAPEPTTTTPEPTATTPEPTTTTPEPTTTSSEATTTTPEPESTTMTTTTTTTTTATTTTTTEEPTITTSPSPSTTTTVSTTTTSRTTGHNTALPFPDPCRSLPYGNVLKNPGFEDVLLPSGENPFWINTTYLNEPDQAYFQTLSLSSGAAVDPLCGTQVGQFHSSLLEPSLSGWSYLEQPVDGLIVGQQYRFTAHLARTTQTEGSYCSVGFFFTDQNSIPIMGTNWGLYGSDSQWKRLTRDFTASTSSGSFSVTFYCNSREDIYIDQFSISPVRTILNACDPFPDGNLILNPGFEEVSIPAGDHPQLWDIKTETQLPGTSVDIFTPPATEGGPLCGTQVLRYRGVPNFVNSNSQSITISHDFENIIIGQEYHLGLFTKIGNLGVGEFATGDCGIFAAVSPPVSEAYPEGQGSYLHYTTAVFDKWSELSGYWTAVSTTARLDLILYCIGSADIYIDQVYFEPFYVSSA